MPWVLLPVLPLFTCYLRIVGDLAVSPCYLLVPLAAWLGRRYGVQGVVTVAVGGAAALFPTYRVGAFEFGGTPDLYVIAVWVSIACAARDPLRALIGEGELFRSSAAFVAALVLLPISIDYGRHDFDYGGTLSLWIGLRPLFLFGLFLFGLAGFAPKRAVAGLAIAAIAGIGIRYFALDDAISAAVAGRIDSDAPWINNFRFRYRWDDLASIATGFGYFFAGHLVERRHIGLERESGFWRHPYPTIVGLTLLAAIGTAVGQLLPPLPDAFELLGAYGDYYALPVAAFLAGFLLRYPGIAIGLGLFVVFVAGSNIAAFMLGRGGLSLSIEQPLFCLAFGMLGLRLRDLMDGVRTTFKARRWVQYAGLVLGILAIVTSSSELASLANAVVVALGAALLAIIVQWVRRALDRRGIRVSGDGWLLLGAILAVLGWLALNFNAVIAGLYEIADDLDMPEGMAVVMTILLLYIPVALLAAGLAKCLPQVWGDIRTARGAPGAREH